jgi:hypothetical protein
VVHNALRQLERSAGPEALIALPKCHELLSTLVSTNTLPTEKRAAASMEEMAGVYNGVRQLFDHAQRLRNQQADDESNGLGDPAARPASN